MRINTVTGEIPSENLGVTLTHEHIICRCEPFYGALGEAFFDRKRTVELSVRYLKHMKEKYKLQTMVDATVLNLGRDLDLLKEVSEKSEVYITSSTGLYWNYEPMVDRKSENSLAELFLLDAKAKKPALLKCAAENEQTVSYSKKLLSSLVKVQKETGLPIYVHTNANLLGKDIAEYVVSIGADTNKITVGHLSDISDVQPLLDIASFGLYIGLDRLRDDDAYLDKNVQYVKTLVEKGYENKILLSHDAIIYSDFSPDDSKYQKENPDESRFTVLFRKFIPKLRNAGIPDSIINRIITENPRKMLEAGR